LGERDASWQVGGKRNAPDTRADHAEYLEGVVGDYDGSRDAYADHLDEAESALRGHLDGYREKWQAVHDAAQKVVASGAGSDDEDKRGNARIAAQAMKTAKRQLRRLGKVKK
jgi:hypothetical protein